MTRIANVQRHVAFRAHGMVRFLTFVQASLDDVEGAAAAGQYGVAAYQARNLVLECLAVRSLAHEGEVDFALESPSFDCFAGLDGDTVALALALARDGTGVDESTAANWLERLRAFVAETETALGYDRPLPVFRSPEGAFGLIALARTWTAALEELGLPPVLPTEWITADTRRTEG